MLTSPSAVSHGLLLLLLFIIISSVYCRIPLLQMASYWSTASQEGSWLQLPNQCPVLCTVAALQCKASCALCALMGACTQCPSTLLAREASCIATSTLQCAKGARSLVGNKMHRGGNEARKRSGRDTDYNEGACKTCSMESKIKLSQSGVDA